MATITGINLYKNALPSLGDSEAALGSKTAMGPSFGEFLKDTATNQISALHKYENAVQASTTGDISGLDLMTTVNEVDIQLQTFKVVWEKFLQEFKGIVEKTAL